VYEREKGGREGGRGVGIVYLYLQYIYNISSTILLNIDIGLRSTGLEFTLFFLFVKEEILYYFLASYISFHLSINPCIHLTYYRSIYLSICPIFRTLTPFASS
jgi:hypothetical protein